MQKLLKLVRCIVDDEHRLAFQLHQSRWKAVSHEAGLTFQIGGWDGETSSLALILAIWESVEFYRSFHQLRHDQLVAMVDHADLIREIETSFFQCLFTLPDNYSPFSGLFQSGYLQLELCETNSDQWEAFVNAQVNLWNPAFHDPNGMRSRIISKNLANENSFLVVSIWESKNHHDEYWANAPESREAANLRTAIKPVQNYRIKLIDDWTVVGKFGNDNERTQ